MDVYCDCRDSSCSSEVVPGKPGGRTKRPDPRDLVERTGNGLCRTESFPGGSLDDRERELWFLMIARLAGNSARSPQSARRRRAGLSSTARSRGRDSPSCSRALTSTIITATATRVGFCPVRSATVRRFPSARFRPSTLLSGGENGAPLRPITGRTRGKFPGEATANFRDRDDRCATLRGTAVADSLRGSSESSEVGFSENFIPLLDRSRVSSSHVISDIVIERLLRRIYRVRAFIESDTPTRYTAAAVTARAMVRCVRCV